MSTPVDIPQNINIHVSHLEKVVETPKTNVADNSADHSSLEFTNKGPDQKKQIIKRDKNKKFQDHYEKSNKNDDSEEKDSSESDEKEQSLQSQNRKTDELDVGNKVDFSV